MGGTTSVKRKVLKESTNTNSNIQSPATKKLKTEGLTPKKFRPPPKVVNGPLKSSQPSQFEEEVLQNLTQGINTLKDKNAEKDQQWARPSLDTFNEKTDSLCFQQIEAEEGVFAGKPSIKLFGVTEV
jgi:DNA polymerase delta subunit 1